MPYDKALAQRLADILIHVQGMKETKMFGGICWLLHGNMCVGIYQEYLVIRVGKKRAEQIITQDSFAREMDITGKVMKGWLMIAPDGYGLDKQLVHYIDHAISFVRTIKRKS